jgi:hypothetical protein
VKPIGGFLGLELPAPRGDVHAGATALASGRACWHWIVQRVRPRRVLVPFFICDAVLEPLVAAGVAHAFYPITERGLPDLAEAPRDDELLLAVNYFGLESVAMGALAAQYGTTLVVDDTQAFYRTGDAASWSFNSARKFFGVPDGGFLYGPHRPAHPQPSLSGGCEHLTRRLEGDTYASFQLYREHEARIGVDLRAISELSSRLLAAVDHDSVRAARRRNFDALHQHLGKRNRMPIGVSAYGHEVPMCYPFLPDVEVSRETLWRRNLFVPQFWPEVLQRRTSGFERERMLASRLLPLPIDQRYGAEDMIEVCERLRDLLA